MGFLLGKRGQRAPERGVKAAGLFGEFFLHERLQVSARLGESEREQTKQIAAAFGALRDGVEDRAEERLENFFDRDGLGSGLRLEADRGGRDGRRSPGEGADSASRG